MLHATLSALLTRKNRHNSCEETYDGIVHALRAEEKYRENTPIPLDFVLKCDPVHGLDYATCCLAHAILPEEKEEAKKISWRFAADCWEHILQTAFSGDDKELLRNAVDVMRRYSCGEATQEDLFAAWYIAWPYPDEDYYSYNIECVLSIVGFVLAFWDDHIRDAEQGWQKKRLRTLLEGRTGEHS